MVVTKLKEFFGENEQFTLEMGKAMIEKMLEKLINNDKEEANSMVGLAMLFGQTGGQLTEQMANLIEEVGFSLCDYPIAYSSIVNVSRKLSVAISSHSISNKYWR